MFQEIILLNRNFKDVNPLICGYQKCCNGHWFGPASREYYLIHYVTSGKGIFKTKNNIYNLSKGMLFIIRPNEITYYEADKNDPWTYIWIGFEVNIDGDLSKLASFLNKDVIHSPGSQYIFESIMKAENLVQSKEVFILGKLYELFSVLIEADKNLVPKNIPETYVLKAENYILMNYMKDITVERIAELLGINRKYFCSIFKEKVGKTPQNYIIDLRMSKAAEFLLNSGYTVTEAANSTGYKDIFNFSKMFKKKFGVSPTKYKEEKS